MKRELLEVREMDCATVHRTQVRTLGSLQRPLYNRMRDAKTFRKRPVTPGSIVGEQSTEDVDVGILDHDEATVSGINTRYNECHQLSGPPIVHVAGRALGARPVSLSNLDRLVVPAPNRETSRREFVKNRVEPCFRFCDVHLFFLRSHRQQVS